MKKLILLLALAVGMTVTAQETAVDSVSTKNQTSYYASVGVSMSNTTGTDFNHASYASVEAGINKGTMSYGLAVGRGNLADLKTDVIQNYWYEGKAYVNRPLGNSTLFLVVGLGNYIDTSKIFIEYGAGFSTPLTSKVSFTGQATNWDSIFYVTPGLQYTF